MESQIVRRQIWRRTAGKNSLRNFLASHPLPESSFSTVKEYSRMIRDAIVQVAAGATLSEGEAATVMEEIMTGPAAKPSRRSPAARE
jgi:hypothetical protein